MNLDRRCCLLFLLVLGSICAQAQSAPSPSPKSTKSNDQADSLAQGQTDQDDSVAAAAARAKAQKNTHSKKVVTDDDVPPLLGPLPPLRMNEAENGEAVVAAIATFKASHPAAETEAAVRVWYDEYDKELATAIQHNLEIKALRGANLSNASLLCQNADDYEHYEQCQARKNTEINGARYDLREMARNNEAIVRLQHSLMNIRNRLFMMGLHYDWFKVRTTNNIDRF